MMPTGMYLAMSGLLLAIATRTAGYPAANEKSGQPKWTELESADREAVLKELTPFLGEVVGPVFITLSNKMELRLIGEDTYLFDAYRLHVPGSKAPYVLLSSASTVDIHEPPPPFQTPPPFSLTPFGITTPGDKAAVIGAEEQAPLEFPSGQDYYKGVPILVPEGLGKISLHAAVVKKLMDQLIVQA